MIPTAILAAFVMGLWVRWWAVPIVALAWAVVIGFADDLASAPGGAGLGAVNALVGVVVAISVRKLFDVAGRGRPAP